MQCDLSLNEDYSCWPYTFSLKAFTVTHGICFDELFGSPLFHDMRHSTETKANPKCKKHKSLSKSILMGKFRFLWIQDLQQPVPQVGHHFRQSFCGSGKSSRNHGTVPDFATGQLCDLGTSAPSWGLCVLSTR